MWNKICLYPSYSCTPQCTMFAISDNQNFVHPPPYFFKTCYDPYLYSIPHDNVNLLILLIFQDGLAITQAYFLKKLIKYFSVGTKVTEKDAYIYALIVSLCSIASLFFNTPYYYHRKITGLLAKEGCITLIYDKVFCY